MLGLYQLSYPSPNVCRHCLCLGCCVCLRSHTTVNCHVTRDHTRVYDETWKVATDYYFKYHNLSIQFIFRTYFLGKGIVRFAVTPCNDNHSMSLGGSEMNTWFQNHPNSFRCYLYMVLPQTLPHVYRISTMQSFKFSYFHHAKFQILLFGKGFCLNPG